MKRTRSGLLMAGALAMSMVGLPSPGPSAAVEATPTEPVTIVVDGASDIMVAQRTPWLNAFFGSPITVEYEPASAAFAREHLLAGDVDAAIFGSPYTDEEKSASKVGTTIEVPVHVSTAVLLMTEPVKNPPPGGGYGFSELRYVSPEENPICDPEGELYDEDECVIRTKVTGPIRVPHANLAAMMLREPGLQTPAAPQWLNAWRHPDVRAALGAPNLNLPDVDAPTFVHRQPGESVNRYLQQYIVTSAPEVWELSKQRFPEALFGVGERMSGPEAVTRSTPSGQAQAVGLFYNNPATNSATDSGWAGNMTAVPPAALPEVKETLKNEKFPPPFRVVEVENGADQWIAPTPDSISKAVAVGGAKPLYALENRVDGAYPLVWVDQLSVRAKGLSPEKTNAVASLVRQIVTQGQEGAAALGEGRLSPALVTEALKGADAIVKSNCVGDGVRAVSASDAGPYAPASLKDAGIGEMMLCERTKAAEPPVAEPEASPDPPVAEEEVFDPGSELASPAPLEEEPELALPEPADAGAPAAAKPKAAPRAKLPYAVLAASPRGVDRLTTILLGAGLFLLGRATLWPRLRKRLG